MGPLRNLGTFRKVALLGKGVLRCFQSFRTGMAGLALREFYEEQGLSRHDTALVIIAPGRDRIQIKERVWLGAFSIIWVGDDSRGAPDAGKMRLGANVYIGDHCNLRAAGGSIEIGDNVLVGNGVTMVATNHGMEPGVPIIDQAWANHPRDIVVESDVWIGAHAVLLPGTRVRRGAIVAAGAVVRGEVSADSVVGGIPAKVLKQRR